MDNRKSADTVMMDNIAEGDDTLYNSVMNKTKNDKRKKRQTTE